MERRRDRAGRLVDMRHRRGWLWYRSAWRESNRVLRETTPHPPSAPSPLTEGRRLSTRELGGCTPAGEASPHRRSFSPREGRCRRADEGLAVTQHGHRYTRAACSTSVPSARRPSTSTSVSSSSSAFFVILDYDPAAADPVRVDLDSDPVPERAHSRAGACRGDRAVRVRGEPTSSSAAWAGTRTTSTRRRAAVAGRADQPGRAGVQLRA